MSWATLYDEAWITDPITAAMQPRIIVPRLPIRNATKATKKDVTQAARLYELDILVFC